MNITQNIDNDIKFLTKSEIRLKILNELQKKPNNVRGLVKNTKITYSSISTNIMKLEQNNNIKKIENKYHITPMTDIYLKTLMDFKNSVDIVNTYEEFWNKHNLNQLTITSIKKITALKNAQLIETTPIDIYKTHNTTKKQMIKSTSVKAIFPYLHPEYPEIIEHILENKGSLEIIIPQTIFKELITRIDRKTRKNAMKNRNLKIYLTKKDLNLYLSITDATISLGLFKNDGSFDQNRILISKNQKSLKWGNDLFEHVKTEVV